MQDGTQKADNLGFVKADSSEEPKTESALRMIRSQTGGYDMVPKGGVPLEDGVVDWTNISVDELGR